MLKNILKCLAGCCLAGVVLLGVQGISAEAAEYTSQEMAAMESQEWKQYVESPEEYTFDSVQTLEDGMVVVVYEKENNADNGIMPLTETITKTKTINFYSFSTLLMTFEETSIWSYGGAVGTTPYFGSASYSARYANFNAGVTSWGTPYITGLATSSNRASYMVNASITYNGRTSIYSYDVVQTFS